METNYSSDFKGAEKPHGFLITGIGASAGGIQALKEFFQHVPADSGIAYVVILHLSPDHDSQLAHVLQVVSAIPVLQVTENTKIEPDHIYVVPPNQHLIIHEGFIAPSVNLHVEERRAPVDIFFRNLADTHGPRAVCVVLSGTGANGSMGLKRIKEMGGVAYVQNPREAEFNEMPRNSIATELVDQVLPVAEIPAKIIAYRNSLGTVEIVADAQKRPEPQQQALREIFTSLRVRTGHDFSNYKRATLLRRIERRINIRNLPDLPAYTKFLQQNPDEPAALLKDLLISVTNFFRDSKSFEALEREVLPAIINSKKSESEVRIWVAGCATGEEAYSIAMLCAEQTVGTLDPAKVQIFATDIDETAIAVAREGYYTLNDAADVSPERLRRFFNKDGDGYRVRREIREMILFANHNFLKDPPFSRLDLVTCRNVLIYLNSTAQDRVMETFHFALNPGGFLFLGSSESVDGASDLYATLNRENHIFQAREVSARSFPVPESVPTFHFTKNDQLQKTEEKEARSRSRTSFGELHQKLLEQYASPSVVVNEEYDILHMSEKVGKYFEIPGGEPTQNVLKLIRTDLRLELRSALYQAVQRKTAVDARNVKMGINGQAKSIDIHVRPVTQYGDGAKGFILVIFDENEENDLAEAVMVSSDEPVAKQLEEELIHLKTQLRNSIEQHEFQSEELKASNEELQAMNEELRSAAEELETSKEELQSINEELRTVNQELKIKIEETSFTSNNLKNLINSANVGTIFLDRSFCTRMYTPAVLEIFNLIPSDYGRPISDITHRLQYDGLLHDAERVLEKLTIVEREVTTADHRSFMMRVLPYRTSEDRINGVVVTFFDITKRKEAEKALEQSEQHMRLLIESAKDYAIFTLDIERKVVSWSIGAQMLFGYAEAEIIGKSGDIVFVPEDRQEGTPVKEAGTAEKERRAENERWHVRKDGSRFWASGSTSPLHDNEGKLVGFVKIMRDLTEKKQMEEAKLFLASIVETSNDSVITIDFQRNITSWNKAAEDLYGYTAEEAIGKNLSMLTLPEDFVQILDKVDAVEHSREVVVFDTVRNKKGGEPIHLEIVMSPVLNASGEVIGVSTIARDVSERKRRETNLAFLATINLDFAPLLTLHDVMEPVGEQLASYLQLSRCHFSLIHEEDDRVEVVYEYRRDEGLASIKGAHRISDNLTEEGRRHFGSGKVAVMNAAADSSLVKTPAHMLKQFGFGSLVDVPHLEGGRWRFLLTVGRTEVSEWRSDELELLQELAHKIYIRIQRARAEEALRKSEEVFRSFVSASSQMVYKMSADWKQMQFLNGKDFLVDTETTIDSWLDIYIPEHERERVANALEEAIHAKQIFNLEHQVYDSNGNLAWIYSSAVPMLNQDGEIVEWIGAGTNITERKTVEEALRQSEEKYRSLFNSIDEGFCLFEMLYDETGKAINYRYLDVNPVFERQTGLKNVVDKTVAEVTPGTEQYWIETYDKVARTGESIRFENYHEATNRWYYVYASRVGNEHSRRVATVFNDITERKIAEERQNYLLQLNDALRRLSEPEEAQLTAARLLGKHLGVARAFYCDMEADSDHMWIRHKYLDGVESQEGYFKITDFGPFLLKEYRAGRTVVMQDVETDERLSEEERAMYPAINVRAFVCVPFVKGSKLTSVLAVNQPTPRKWTQAELAIIEETAERTWAAVERAKAEEALRNSEERLQKALSIETVGVIYFNLQGVIHDSNIAFERMSGLSIKDLKKGTTLWQDLTPPEFMEASHKAEGELMTQGQSTPYEKQYICPDGSRWWGLFAGKRLSENEFVEFVVDITAGKKTEEALGQSEARLRTLANAVPQVIWTNTADGKANYFNQRWYEYSGLSYEQSVGLGWQAMVHADDAPASVEKWNKALEAAEVFDTEYRLRGHDGNYRWFIGRNVPLQDDSGKIIGWFGSATDIENLKKTEEALSQSEARLRITMESATDYAIITMDTERRVERWSQGATQIFGYTEAETTGQSADIIYTEEDRKAGVPQKEMETARDTGRAADERWHQRKDGSRFFVSGVMRPIQNSLLTSYVKVMRDTTQQQLFTEELHRLVNERTAELKRSNEDLRQFAHVASHDLKEPVRKIQTFNNRLKEEFFDKLPDKARLYTEKIDSASKRMRAMIDGVLFYSKVNNARQTFQSVDLNTLIRQIETDLDVLIELKRGVLAATELPVINASNTLMYQLFYNLILNSLKFSVEGKPSVINISSSVVEVESKKFHRILVSDNGIGFDAEYNDVIFNTFTRLHSADEYEGTGLGLALCKRIVERHNGTISADSRENEGATFIILLPVS